jgi:hypothetical protein
MSDFATAVGHVQRRIASISVCVVGGLVVGHRFFLVLLVFQTNFDH